MSTDYRLALAKFDELARPLFDAGVRVERKIVSEGGADQFYCSMESPTKPGRIFAEYAELEENTSQAATEVAEILFLRMNCRATFEGFVPPEDPDGGYLDDQGQFRTWKDGIAAGLVPAR